MSLRFPFFGEGGCFSTTTAITSLKTKEPDCHNHVTRSSKKPSNACPLSSLALLLRSPWSPFLRLMRRPRKGASTKVGLGLHPCTTRKLLNAHCEFIFTPPAKKKRERKQYMYVATPPDFGHFSLRKSSQTPMFIVLSAKKCQNYVSKISYTDFGPFV